METKKLSVWHGNRAQHKQVALFMVAVALSAMIPIVLFGAAAIGWVQISIVLSTIEGLLWPMAFSALLLAAGATAVSVFAVGQACQALFGSSA